MGIVSLSQLSAACFAPLRLYAALCVDSKYSKDIMGNLHFSVSRCLCGKKD